VQRAAQPCDGVTRRRPLPYANQPGATFGDWIAYVEAQPEAERAAGAERADAVQRGVRLEQRGDGWWLTLVPISRTYSARQGEPIRYDGRTRHAIQDWSKLPVLGISATDAVAYAAWLDRSGGLAGARLCSELEWEAGGARSGWPQHARAAACSTATTPTSIRPTSAI